MWDVGDKIASEFCHAENQLRMLIVQADSRGLRTGDIIPYVVEGLPDRRGLGT